MLHTRWCEFCIIAFYSRAPRGFAPRLQTKATIALILAPKTLASSSQESCFIRDARVVVEKRAPLAEVLNGSVGNLTSRQSSRKDSNPVRVNFFVSLANLHRTIQPWFNESVRRKQLMSGSFFLLRLVTNTYRFGFVCIRERPLFFILPLRCLPNTSS